MNCATASPAEQSVTVFRTLEKDKRISVSRGLTSCLRGERDEMECKNFKLINYNY
jgi:hypothetical protein